MDFSKVKEITIPEGKVKEISIGGQVVWKMKPAGVPTTRTGSFGSWSDCTADVSVVDASGTAVDLPLGSADVLIPVGSTITANIATHKGYDANAEIDFNGSRVGRCYGAYGSDSYSFKVTADMTSIRIYQDYYTSGVGKYMDVKITTK